MPTRRDLREMVLERALIDETVSARQHKAALIGPPPDQKATCQGAQSPRRIAPCVEAQRHKALPAGIFDGK